MIHPENLIIAHRGESFDAPENTLASINLAWERGIKSVEVDIHLTKDKEIVVIHDKNTRRVAGTRKIIRKSSLNELRQLNAGKHKGVKWNKELIPTLKEVLNSVPSSCRLIIEIKSDSRIIEKLKIVLEESDLKNSQVELIGYNAKTLAAAKLMMPGYKMLWILDLDYYLPHWMVLISKNNIIEKLKKYNLDGVDVWAGRVLRPSFIKDMKQNGFLVYSWTVDSRDKARYLIDNGIDGITSNRGAFLIEELKSNAH
ncbi:MAG: glycerophosphodiester phosphodiesterase family protein [Bacteroidales bacterium]|nr:glycerophosphodiester phosphodiesterase family protein [Bacteroidales bacterium]